MNRIMDAISGKHRTFHRETGDEVPDQRRLTFSALVDNLIPLAVVGLLSINVTLLGWLCMKTTTLSEQMAGLLVTKQDTEKRLDKIEAAILREADERKSGDAILMNTIDEYPKKARR